MLTCCADGLVEYVALAEANEVPGFYAGSTQFGVPYVEFTATEAARGKTAVFHGGMVFILSIRKSETWDECSQFMQNANAEVLHQNICAVYVMIQRHYKKLGNLWERYGVKTAIEDIVCCCSS